MIRLARNLGGFFSEKLRSRVIRMLLCVAIASGKFSFIIFFGLLHAACFRSYIAIKKAWTFYALIVFLIIFFICFKAPELNEYSYLTPRWLFGLVVSICVSFLFGYSNQSIQEAEINFFWVAYTTLCYAAISIFATLIWMSPPYYGQVFDIINGGSGSGSRASNLMLLAPILLCGFVTIHRSRDRLFYTVLAMSVLSLFLNFVLEKRLYFMTAFLVLPILFIVFNPNFCNFRRVTLTITIFCLTSFLFYNQLIDKFFVEYSRNGGRIWLYESFFKQIMSGSSTHVATPRSMTDAPLWFHNIFMDVYRISGSWAACAFIGLFLLYACRLFTLYRSLPVVATAITCWFVPLFIISNLSVVPEGEPQFLLLMVFMMGLTERMLRPTDFGIVRSV